MRNLLFFCLLSIILSACTADEKINDSYLEILPIESVSLPDEFINGEVYEITYTYIRPTTCHIFNDLYYIVEGDLRTVAVINTVFEETGNGNPCENLEEQTITREFEFIVNNEVNTSYTFRFWQGKDENGDDIYLTIDVPVAE